MLYSSIKGQKCDNGCTFQYYCPADRCIYKKESNRYFATFKLLKQHYQKVHAEKVYKCEKCPAAFGLERELRRHAGHCGTMYKCGSCPASYTTRETLQSHCTRKAHMFPEEYAAKNSKQKSRNKQPASAAMPEPKPLPVAVLILGIPVPTNNQPKLPKAILPKDIETTIQGIAAAQAQHTEQPVKDTGAPVKHNAVIQTEIYGVENLAVEGQENQTEHNRGLGMKANKTVSKAVNKLTKAKQRADKENPAVSRKKKSSTGMQTSVSLFSRKRLKTVTGTQTSGDYILKKAMASADIPIQRKTVASQVTPQKPNANLKRKTSMCSSETQTGVSPEKQSKIDGKEALSIDNGIDGLRTEEQKTISDNAIDDKTDYLGDSLSTSTQTLQSYLENLKEGAQTNGSFLSFSPTGNLIVTPLNVGQTDSSQVIEDANQAQLSQRKTSVFRATKGQESSDILKSTTVDADNFTNSSAVLKSAEHVDGTASVEPKGLDSELQIQHELDSTQETNISKQRCIQDNNPPCKKKSKYHKERKTIRNLLNDSTNNKTRTVSALPSTKPLISTTSGITFNSNTLTYSDVKHPQLESSVPLRITGEPTSPVKGGETDYDSHKLFNPVRDEMFSSKPNDAGNTIDMEAQTMSADEFEQLLLASGLLLQEPHSQKVSEITDVNYLKSAPVCATTDIGTGKIATDFVHKEMETEMLSGPDFDFLNETSATIDMNTQTITDFSSLFGETYGPTDSDTQTVANIDFLDLVMTNMETQTLSDRDLIDLGLMDPNQNSFKPNNSSEDDLKSSQTQTSFTAQKLDGASTLDKNNEGETNTAASNQIATVIVTDIVLEKEVNTTKTKADNQDENKTTVEQTSSNVKDNIEKHATTSVKQTEAQSEQDDQSNDFQTTNMETQTAFDDLEKMLLE